MDEIAVMRKVWCIAPFLLALVPGWAVASSKTPADPRAWPTAYEATTMQATELLAAVRKASGPEDGPTQMRLTYGIRESGMDGTEREVWDGGNYRIDTTVGPFVTAYGTYDGQRWETNENGYTLLVRGINQRTEANARALERTQPSDDVKLLGRLRQPADVYVLAVAPKDGREERRFYDATTLRLVRREVHYLDQLVVTTYDDYRVVKGVALAYHILVSDGHPANDLVYDVKSFDPAAQVVASEVEVPGSRRLPVELPAGATTVKLPARIDESGHIIVRVTIAGRGLDFQLDSGCAGIVIDRDVARQLKLPMYGGWTTTVAGTFNETRTVIPEAAVGPIVMHDLVADAMPFQFQNDEATKVVGLLGYDFIAGAVLKINYADKEVDAIPSDRFTVPARAIALDAVLDDEVPMIAMRVNDAIGSRFVLDTGADLPMVFTGFAHDHPSAVADDSPNQFVSKAFNFVYAEGVGGLIKAHVTVLAEVQLSNVYFDKTVAMVLAGGQAEFEGEDADGLIGATLLTSFDVYLDYMNSRVVLVPNRLTKPRTPAKK